MENITFNNLTDKQIINGKEHAIFEVEKIETLLNKNQVLKEQAAEYNADILALRDCVNDILRLMGLFDEETQSIKEDIKTGEESFIGPVLKSLGDVTVLLTQSKMPVFGKKYEEKLVQKFSFIKRVLPLVEKYGNRK